MPSTVHEATHLHKRQHMALTALDDVSSPITYIRQFPSRPWFSILTRKQQKLTELTVALYLREIRQKTTYSDYGFLVFPLSKVYEGFLKKYFLSLNLIDVATYKSKRFRIGRALNPDVHQRQRDELWLYDDVAHLCGPPLARQLWDTWISSRNKIFHYFPEVNDYMSLTQAGTHLVGIADSMESAIQCHWDTFFHEKVS